MIFCCKLYTILLRYDALIFVQELLKMGEGKGILTGNYLSN